MSLIKHGGLLVIGQFSLLGLLTFLLLSSDQQLISSVWYFPAFIPGVWAIYHMRKNKWGVHPRPKTGNILSTSGPYTYMRHPMYFSVMAFSLIATLQLLSYLSVGIFLLLVVTITLKIRIEEQLLVEKYPEYHRYRSEVGIFSPWL